MAAGVRADVPGPTAMSTASRTGTKGFVTPVIAAARADAPLIPPLSGEGLSGQAVVEDRHRADGRAGSAAQFERQADEAELALADQRLEVAQAFDVGDVEVEARLVDEGVDDPHRPRPHGIDAEMHDPLPRQPFGR